MNDMPGKDGRIYIAGHRGLVGSSIVRALERHGYTNLVMRTHDELDLTDQRAVRDFFAKDRFEFVFLAAARVGGILANSEHPAEFVHQNLAIQTNVIHEGWRAGVKRLLFLGSSCIYPRDCPQPIREEYLLTGPLEKTNEAYAVAKIAGIQMCSAYNAQYGTEYLCAMPTNLYGTGDNYDLKTSHVLPALIRKAHEAKISARENIVAWGSGTPRREFLFSDDLAEACVLLMGKRWDEIAAVFPRSDLPLLNIGCGTDVSIAELIRMVCRVVGFQGSVVWDRSKPDGTPQKMLDVSRISSLGWRPETALEEGILVAYRAFLQELHVA
jgi:GDP-L-fucose synthase